MHWRRNRRRRPRRVVGSSAGGMTMGVTRFEPGQVAVVTGAARGIGFGIAQRLAQEGLSVALLDRDATALADAVASLERAGARAIGATVDLTDSAAVNAAF